MRASTIWVLLVAVVLTGHGGYTVASTLVLEDKLARLQAIMDAQGDASSDLSTCTEILSRALQSDGAQLRTTPATSGRPPQNPGHEDPPELNPPVPNPAVPNPAVLDGTAPNPEAARGVAAPVLLTSTR